MRSTCLNEYWTDKHTTTFLKLKCILTSEPVLKPAKYDGMNFIVTTDGSKDGFGGALSQLFEVQLPLGKTVVHQHPITYVSKQTSTSKEKYKPFILEFAALKFALDKFSSITWGFPIKIKTDCQALHDNITKDKLFSIHACWRDGIFAHQIVDVRHRPGISNGGPDSISRQFSGIERTDNDGSNWTVSKDWESTTGLVNDILAITELDSVVVSLQERFCNESVFLDIINALHNLDKATPRSC